MDFDAPCTFDWESVSQLPTYEIRLEQASNRQNNLAKEYLVFWRRKGESSIGHQLKDAATGANFPSVAEARKAAYEYLCSRSA